MPIVFKAFVGSALAQATNSAKKPSKSKFNEGEGKRGLPPRLLLMLLALLRLRVPLLVPDGKMLLVLNYALKERKVSLVVCNLLGRRFLEMPFRVPV